MNPNYVKGQPVKYTFNSVVVPCVVADIRINPTGQYEYMLIADTNAIIWQVGMPSGPFFWIDEASVSANANQDVVVSGTELLPSDDPTLLGEGTKKQPVALVS